MGKSMKITKKSSCLDHKTLSDIKQQHSFGESYCFLHCKVSKLKPNLVAMGLFSVGLRVILFCFYRSLSLITEIHSFICSCVLYTGTFQNFAP
uniref:Uncharacterized protein n=1 Tax=Marmota marmota marmota TaxID=9994 RepID=A0A8C5ZTS1_MARMA